MPIELYYDDRVPVVRSVLMTAKVLNLTIDLHEVNFITNDQFPAEIAKVNKLKKLPILIDSDVVLWESHAIIGYLVKKYGQNVFPNDVNRQAQIEQFLYFNCNTLLPRLDVILLPIILFNEKEISKEKLTSLREGYELLEKLLEGEVFLVGQSPTVADFCCVSTISSASIILPISSKLFPNIFAWYQRCKTLPYYEETNGCGLHKLDELIDMKLGGNCHKTMHGH